MIRSVSSLDYCFINHWTVSEAYTPLSFTCLCSYCLCWWHLFAQSWNWSQKVSQVSLQQLPCCSSGGWSYSLSLPPWWACSHHTPSQSSASFQALHFSCVFSDSIQLVPGGSFSLFEMPLVLRDSLYSRSFSVSEPLLVLFQSHTCGSVLILQCRFSSKEKVNFLGLL